MYIMDQNNYLTLNPQKCERYLSAFGKKVLSVLVTQWDKEREQKKQYAHRQYNQNKRILNFNCNSIHNTSSISGPKSPPLQMYIEENTFNLNGAKDIIPNVPTSKELTTSCLIQEDTDKNDFAHPTIVSSNIVQLCNRSSDDESYVRTNEKENSIFGHINRKGTPDVNWENMFDSELLDNITDDIRNVEINAVLGKKLFIESSTNQLDIVLNKDDNERSGGKRKTKTGDNSNIAKKSRKENIKRNEQSNIKDSKSSTDRPKISFLKQKYTKTVKKWLNDVESYSAINEEIGDVNNYLNNNHTKLDTSKQEKLSKIGQDSNKYKITIDKSVKANKKVVQAQLANKDGVMKFAKPKKADSNDNEVHKDKKDKVTKKFIPPIKSQIPVKDVTYEIIAVDDRNVNECYDALFELKEELIAILIYTNGFCQLNNHFTDGTCSPDGILLGTGDNMFFCFKDVGQKVKEVLTRLLANNKLVITYGAQSILIYLTSYLQMDIQTITMYDCKIGASLLDPDNSPENFSDLQKLLSFTPSYTIATECTLQKTAWYISLLRDCWSKLKDMLVENQLWQVFVEIEMKLLPIIAEMEHRGVSIDISRLKCMEETLLARMKMVEQECYKAAGKVFQINSTVQVRTILYDELQLDTKCNVKIRETLSGGVKSTSETMLRSLMSVHPLPKLILEYRHLHKAYATFVAGIAQHVKDGTVRPTWVQTAAATGRIASNNPNLQAIPKTSFSLVMFPETNDTKSLQLNFRSVYVSRPGCSFVAADFKHVECRVFAHAAADTGLLRALTHSDDLFKVLAAQWLNKSEGTVSAAERERTKRLVYASLYGAGTRKLMEILDVSYEQALQVAASFNRTFPSLKSFGRHVVSQCSQAGGRLSTLCGRMRHFANINSEDFNLRSHAERQAVNFIIQGSAADLCKTAMILTAKQLRSTLPLVDARLVLQIHDELVWEVNDQHVHIAAGIIKCVMEGCGQHCGMSMALPVAVTVGKNWGEMEEYVVY